LYYEACVKRLNGLSDVGANGKSTLNNICQEVLGLWYRDVGKSLLMTSSKDQKSSAGAASPHLAGMNDSPYDINGYVSSCLATCGMMELRQSAPLSLKKDRLTPESTCLSLSMQS
jgi:hypothetical protein